MLQVEATPPKMLLVHSKQLHPKLPGIPVVLLSLNNISIAARFVVDNLLRKAKSEAS